MSFGLEAANRIISEILAEARRRNLAPMAVAVLDNGGNLVAFQREDRAGHLRYDIAYAKAWGALGMGFSSRELAKRAAHNPVFITALAAVSQGRIAPSPGGVLFGDATNPLAGAVGVSGDLGDQDEACALVGLAAAGFTAIADAV